MRYRALAPLLLTAVFMLMPGISSAAAHHLVCADLPNGGTSCDSGTLTMNASGNGKYNSGSGKIFTPGTTYYFSFTASGTGTGYYGYIASASDVLTNSFTSGTYADQAIEYTPNLGGSDTWNSYVWGDTPGFTGTVSDMCWSDAPDECGPPPGGGGTGSSTIPVASSTVSILEAGDIIFMLGWIVFFLALIAMGMFISPIRSSYGR